MIMKIQRTKKAGNNLPLPAFLFFDYYMDIL